MSSLQVYNCQSNTLSNCFWSVVTDIQRRRWRRVITYVCFKRGGATRWSSLTSPATQRASTQPSLKTLTGSLNAPPNCTCKNLELPSLLTCKEMSVIMEETAISYCGSSETSEQIWKEMPQLFVFFFSRTEENISHRRNFSQQIFTETETWKVSCCAFHVIEKSHTPGADIRRKKVSHTLAPYALYLDIVSALGSRSDAVVEQSHLWTIYATYLTLSCIIKPVSIWLTSIYHTEINWYFSVITVITCNHGQNYFMPLFLKIKTLLFLCFKRILLLVPLLVSGVYLCWNPLSVLCQKAISVPHINLADFLWNFT